MVAFHLQPVSKWRKLFLLISFPGVFLCLSAYAQTVDKVRLGYDSTQISSKQSHVAVSGSGQYIAFAYHDQTIKVFDVLQNRFVTRFQPVRSKFFDFKLTRNGDKVIIVTDSMLYVADWRKGTIVGEFKLKNQVTRSAFLANKNLIAVGMVGGNVSVYNIDSMELVTDLQNIGKYVSVLDISPEGNWVVVGSIDKLKSYPLRLYDIKTGKIISELKKEIYTTAFFDQSGKRLIVAGLKIKPKAIKFLLVIPFIPVFVFDLHVTKQTELTIRIITAVLLVGSENALFAAFKSKTFVEAWEILELKDRIDVLLTNNTSVSKREQLASITYYQQGTTDHDKILLLTHTQAFDVFDRTKSIEQAFFSFKSEPTRKIFTTDEERKSYKASSNFIGKDIQRIYRLGTTSKFLINCYQNNINQIYDAEKNIMVGYFFSDSNEDFAIVSKDGRIDGTQNALGKIFWTSRHSTKRTSLESTFEKKFTPKLLLEIVNGTNYVAAEFEIEKTLAEIPVLKINSINDRLVTDKEVISTSQKRLSVNVEVTENNKEVTELRLYQNGKLTAVLPGQTKSDYHFDVNLTNAFGEDNYFYITAYTRSNVESEKSKFAVKYEGATDAQPILYLVTIGIDQYKNPKYNLNYANADADGVEKDIMRYSSPLVKSIVKYSLRNDQALKSGVLSTIQEIRSVAKEQDILLFYYAGHGVMEDNNKAESDFYIVPSDVTQLYGDQAMLKEKAISATELKEYSQSINAQKQIFILDACQSAGALESVSMRGQVEDRTIARLAKSTGTFWITSTGSDQFASEFEKLGHGVFTYALLRGLSGEGDTNKDGKVTILELSAYLQNKVPDLSEQYKGTAQYPATYSFGSDFPIVLFSK